MRKLLCLMAMVALYFPAVASAHEGHPQAQKTIEVQVTKEGFVPSQIEVAAGKPVTIAFRRTTDETCATEAVFPSLKRRVKLPLNTPVRVTLQPRSGQSIAFACGMGMYSGKVVVR